MKPGNIVLLHGVVRGMGREAECDVLARRVAASPDLQEGASGAFPFQDSFTYTDCSVVEAPAELPDGEYVAQFEGYSLEVRRHHGLWLSRGAAVPDDAPVFCD